MTGSVTLHAPTYMATLLGSNPPGASLLSTIYGLKGRMPEAAGPVAPRSRVQTGALSEPDLMPQAEHSFSLIV